MSSSSRPSEYERDTKALEPLLEGVALSDVGDADVAFLAGATGIPAVRLAGLADAARRAAGEPSGLPIEVWYGWRREGLALDPDVLWRMPTDELLAALHNAVAAGVVPAGICEVDGLGAQIERHKHEYVLNVLALAEDTSGALAPLAALMPDEWLELAYANGSPEGAAITPDGSAEADVEKLVEGLRQLQRLAVLGATWEEAASLLDNGLSSPHQLLAAGPARLTEVLDGQIAAERVAAMYRRALELQPAG